MGKLKQHYMDKAETHANTVFLICIILHQFPDLYLAKALELSVVNHLPTDQAKKQAWEDAFDGLATIIASSFPIEPAPVTVQDIKDAHSWLLTTHEDNDILQP